MQVYRIPFSTNVERVALAAGHKRLPVEWVDVDPGDRSPVEAVSGQGRVPVLVADDGKVVCDSTAIIEWIEERHPEPPLLPRDPTRRAEVQVFVEWFNRVWKRYPIEIEGQLVDAEPDKRTSIEAEAAGLRAALDLFEALLEDRDYLFGDFGIADVIAFPFLRYAVLGVPPGDAWVRRVDGHPRS